ncbi:MAG: hypothetical protein IAA89_04780 [Firmicutes bacterium]|uniref:Uncharacterized protein n=1 Tax=Candidatus Gallilactobacillus intestinavium TaxID=2840838 RepID=A0A9D9E8D4_9LACO|nr:hypothetical protein [Candidatus Gallilactobacillus intestinavium]
MNPDIFAQSVLLLNGKDKSLDEQFKIYKEAFDLAKKKDEANYHSISDRISEVSKQSSKN